MLMDERFYSRDDAHTREQIRRMIDEGSPEADLAAERQERLEQIVLAEATLEALRRRREAHAHMSRKAPR